MKLFLLSVLCIIISLLQPTITKHVKEESFYYYLLGHGDTCHGNGTVEKMDIVVSYDIRNIYSPIGWNKSSNPDNQRYYRWTLCGNLAESTCNGNTNWCFEQINQTNTSECIAGLSKWKQTLNTSISYSAIFYTNDTNKPTNPVGFYIQIANEFETNKECPNDLSFINYNLICSSGNKTVVTSLYENYTECVWNVSYLTPFGCLSWKPINTSTTTSAPININCKWYTTDGYFIDLSSTKGAWLQYSYESYDYFYSPCMNDLICYQNDDLYVVMALQLRSYDDFCESYLAVWNNTSDVVPIYSPSKKSFILTYDNGQVSSLCQNGREFIVEWKCDYLVDNNLFYVESAQELSVCIYQMIIKSPLACNTNYTNVNQLNKHD